MSGHRPQPPPPDTDQRFARPRSPPTNLRRSNSNNQHPSSSNFNRQQQQQSSSSSSSSSYPPSGPSSTSNNNRSGSPPRHPRDSSSSAGGGGKDRFNQGSTSSSSEAFEKSRWAGTNTTSSSSNSNVGRKYSESDGRQGNRNNNNNSSGRNGEFRQASSSYSGPSSSSSTSQSHPSQQQQQQSDRRVPYAERERYRDPDAPISNYQQQPAPLFNSHRQQQSQQQSSSIGGGGPSSAASQHSSSNLSYDQARARDAYNANTRDVASDQIPNAMKTAGRKESWTRPSRGAPPTGPQNPNRPAQQGHSTSNRSPPHHQRARSPASSDRYASQSSSRPPLPIPPSRPSHPSSSSSSSRQPVTSSRGRSRSPPAHSTTSTSRHSSSKDNYESNSGGSRKRRNSQSGDSSRRSRSRSESSNRSANGDRGEMTSSHGHKRRSSSSSKKPSALLEAIVMEMEERTPPRRSPTPPRAVSRSPRSQSSASSTASPEPSSSKLKLGNNSMDWTGNNNSDKTNSNVASGVTLPLTEVADYAIPEEGEPKIGVDGDEEEVNDRKRRRLPESARTRKEKRLKREEKEAAAAAILNANVEMSIPTGPSSSRINGNQQQQQYPQSHSNGNNTPIHSTTPTGPRALRDRNHSIPQPPPPFQPSLIHNYSDLPPPLPLPTPSPAPLIVGATAPISLLSLSVPTGPKSQTLPKFIQSFSSSTGGASNVIASNNVLIGIPTGPKKIGAGLKRFFPGEEEEAEEEERRNAEKEKERIKEVERENERDRKAELLGDRGDGRGAGNSRDFRRGGPLLTSNANGGKKDDRWAKTNKGPITSSSSASSNQRDVRTSSTQQGGDSRDDRRRSDDSRSSWGREDPKNLSSYDNNSSSNSSSTRGSPYLSSNYERGDSSSRPNGPSSITRHSSHSEVASSSAPNGSPRYNERGDRDSQQWRESDRERDRGGRDRERDRGRDIVGRGGKFVPPNSDSGYSTGNVKAEEVDRNQAAETSNGASTETMEVEAIKQSSVIQAAEDEEMGPPAIPTPTEVKIEPIPKDTESSVIPGRALIGSEELYERLVQVGEGTYGKVYKARNLESGHLVALKRIRMEAEKDGFPVTAIREIKLLQSLRHPNVVDLIEMMVSKGHVYMVFEYMDHDLTGVLHHPSIQFTPAHLKSFMSQFLLGLGFIHRRGVLHRDLKGSNILIGKNGELKIADFGLARFYARGRNNDYTNRVITQWYKPPELLFGATVYGAEVDMWSAGCIFLELFTRRPIFQGQDEIHQLDVIFKITGTPNETDWPGVEDLPWYELVKPKAVLVSQLRETYSKWLTPGGLALVERLLTLNPKGRPTADETLQMDYFTIEDPRPELPVMLADVQGSWHEYESKRARKRQKEEAADV